MAGLRLGPLLRQVDWKTGGSATVWVETDRACVAEVVCDDGARGSARTWRIEDHHYALVHVEGLRPGHEVAYRVLLDGEQVWPLENPPDGVALPVSTIRTPVPGAAGEVRVAFGSCRWASDLQQALSFVALEGMDGETIMGIYNKIDALKQDRYNQKISRKHSSSSLRDLVEAYLNEGGKNRLLFHKEIPKPLCTAFFTHLRLLPNGDLTSCSIRRNKVVANLRDESFSKIWWSLGAHEERKEVKLCKGCWSECDIAPSIFYSGDIIRWYLKKKIWGSPPMGVLK